MAKAFLSEITIYPIKSLGGVSMPVARVESRGLQFDRRWLLIDCNNQFLTQREFPKMATISIEIEAENLRVKAARKPDLLIGLQPESTEKVRVQIWSDVCDAILLPEKTNRWFSEVLDTDCRLVFMPDDARRPVEAEYAVSDTNIVNFSDAFPFLLIGESSLENLNSRLAKPISINRFRPNFTIKNTQPFAEDDWRQIKIGESVFHAVKPCARCVMTNVNQETGELDGKDPLQTLAGFRTTKRNGKNKVLFGQYLIAENQNAVVRAGDPIEILK